MSRTLVSNVEVGGNWYGPSYPDNAVTEAVARAITNPAAWSDTAKPEDVHPDVRFAEGADVPVGAGPGEMGSGKTVSAAEATASDAPEPSPDEEVPDGNVEDVLHWVDEDPDRAQRALEVESAKPTPRTTLVDALEDVLTKS